MFIARARPLTRAAECRVAGCDRESIARRGLCRFHGQRLQRRGLLSGDELAAWVDGERPRLGVHQFSLAGLPELLRVELLYGLQHRDQAPPPLDPTEVRILLARLGDAASLREADPQVVCESGGMVYNAGTRGLFRDLRRHLDRAWAQHTGLDPFAGDVWQVALLDLRINASRRWPATRGVLDFRGIEPAVAARGRQGLGPRHPALPAAAPRDLARLPGRLPHADRRRPDRPGQPRRRRLHRRHRRHQRAAASRRHPVFRLAPQLDALPVLPGHRARPRQRADGHGARPVPPGSPPPDPPRPQRGRGRQGAARHGDRPARCAPAPARPGRPGRGDQRRRPAGDAPQPSTGSCATPGGAPARWSACTSTAWRSSTASTT